jgi:UDP-N-acetylmuramoyl-L-alanyl-D-glutamate--2,6-diaminopimelate ligase
LEMKLESIARILGAELPAEEAHLEVGDLAYDSRRVAPGALFICIQGGHFDGHDYADAAVRSGAVAIVCERPVGAGVPELRVEDSRVAMNRLAAPFFGNPSRQLGVAGVTGTNGKTTIAFMLESIFRAGGEASGMIGTVESRVGGRSVPAGRTTPEAVDIQRLLREMVDEEVKRCVLEVTSIGIDSGRVQGIGFDVAVFTNLTHDHLDHHRTMERYYSSKVKLFTDPAPGAAVINHDDPYGQRLLAQVAVPATTYGLSAGADLRAEDVKLGARGSSFVAVGQGLRQPVKLALSGRFNVSNALAAIAAAGAMGIGSEVAAAGIERLGRVPGRFEPVREGQDFMVFVDYAHTPDGLDNVLRAANDLGGSRVIAVFGCGGDRDKAKRPLMGRAAGRHADVVFVTSDNPRTEDPHRIAAEIEEGLKAEPPAGGYELIEDREQAIRAALGAARTNDVVVIAGKGHETGQERDGRITPFDDRIVAARALKELR